MDNIQLSDIQGNTKLADVKLSSLSLSADSLKSVINNIIDSDNAKLPLSGGTLTGTVSSTSDVTIDGKLTVGELSAGKSNVGELTCQSMVMTNYVDMMHNYCDKGGVIMSNMGKYTCFRERGSAIMNPTPVGGCVGATGYCVLSACNDTTTGKGMLKLSGDITPLKEITTKLGDKCKWSLTMGGACQCWTYTISSYEDVTADDGTISAAVVHLKQAIDADNISNTPKTEAACIALWNNQVASEDDCAFYSPFAPWAGNQSIPVMYNGLIEGNACRAIQRATHAEGRMCLADARYSHAEGSYSYATGLASHAEGYTTLASGGYSHAEGQSSTASGPRAHAEGYNGTASGEASHTEGGACYATGKYSHAEGNSSKATGESSHAGGQGASVASGAGSFAHGWKATAAGDYSVAIGYQTNAACNQAFAAGYGSTAGLTIVGFKITAVDTTNSVVTLDALSAYNGSTIYPLSSFAGKNVTLIGFDDGYTHVETFTGITLTEMKDASKKTFTLSKVPTFASTSTNKVLKVTDASNYGNTLQFGTCQFAIGSGSTAKGTISLAVGDHTTSGGRSSIAAGYYANAAGKYSVVWNGVASDKTYGSTMTADGLFCINPVGGAEGFYIGTQTLSAIISAAVKAGIDDYKKSLTAG